MSRIKRMKRMIAKYEYVAQNEGDVSLRKGETMYMQNTLEEAESSGWAIVVKNDDSEGSVPFSYIEVAPAPPPPPVDHGSSSPSKKKERETRIEKEAGLKHLQMEKEAEIGELLERLKVFEKKFNITSTVSKDSNLEKEEILKRLKGYEERDKQSEREKNQNQQIHFIKHPNKSGFAVDGLNVRFVADGNSKTLFFDKPVNEGILKLSLSVEGHGSADFAIGVARVKDVKTAMTTLIGTRANSGVCFRQGFMASYIGNNDGSTSERLVPKDDTLAVNGGFVSLEVDTKKHTVHIFNNGKQLNYYITNIPSFVLFGFGSAGTHSVKFLSLDELQQPSIDETLDKVPIRWAD